MPQWVFPPQATPRRRKLDAILEGLGEALTGYGQFAMKRSLVREEAAGHAATARQGTIAGLLKDFGDKVIKGDLEPEQASAALHAQGLPVPTSYFSSLSPSPERVTSGLMESIGKAPTMEQVPSAAGILGSVPSSMKRVRLGATESPSVPDETTGQPTLPSTQLQPVSASPDLDRILAAASQKRNAFTTPVDTVNASGIKQRTYQPEASLQGKTFPTEATPEQKGALTSRELTTENAAGLPALRGTMAGTTEREKALTGDLSPAVVGRKVEAANQTETGTRAGKAATAYATSRASDQAAFDVKTNAANVARQRAIDGGLPPHIQQASFQLAGDFAQQSKDYYTMESAYRKMAELYRAPGGVNSAANSLGMIFGYMKLLDPGSTVREGEQASAQNAGSVPERIRAMYNRVLTGGRLDQQQRKDFFEQGGLQFRAEATTHQRRVDDFTKRAAAYGVPPDLVIRNPALDLLQQPQSPLDIVRARGRGRGQP